MEFELGWLPPHHPYLRMGCPEETERGKPDMQGEDDELFNDPPCMRKSQ